MTGDFLGPRFGRPAAAITFAAVAALDTAAGGLLAQFYAIPVTLAAMADGWLGGLIAAGFSSAVMFVQPAGSGLGGSLAGSAGLASLGVIAGLIFDRERRQRESLRATADQLSTVYERVQANFEGMKRVERLSAIGQLSAGLAHEIRNPLASIAGAAAILRRNENLEPKHARCVDIIASECNRLDGLVTNFLEFARPRPPRLRSIEIGEVLDSVFDLAGHGLRGKNVHCEKHKQPGLPMVEGDPEQLEQVLLNLVINAIEASPNGETVTLLAEAVDGMVAVRVIDRGHGVAPAHVERLFDPFFTTKEHGTGLGLPVAHQIMTQMGGALTAQSNSQGMTFSILIPTKREES